MKIVSLFTVVLLFIFTGCGKQAVQPLKTPDWFLLSPNNNSLYLYGSGQGYNIQEAKTNALNDMSSRLVVGVGSVINTKTTTDNQGGYSKDVSRDVTVEAKKINFNNATVSKTEQVGSVIYMLMQIDRNEFFASKQKEFLSLDSRIDDEYQNSLNKSVLEQIFALQNMEEKLNQGKAQAIVLYAIDNGFNYTKYTKKYDSYIDKIDMLKSNISVSVKSNDSHKFFADVISKYLNAKKYKIVDTNADIEINLNNKIRYSVAMGWQVAKVTTTISTTTNGKTLANNIISTVGRSSSTQTNALSGASVSFDKNIETLGIDKILFDK